jgi:hypothetical protein
MPTKKKTVKKTVSKRESLMSMHPKITDAAGAAPLAAFISFPETVAFDGQDTGEQIVLFVRQHPIVLFPKIIMACLGLLLPIIMVPVLGFLKVDVGLSDVPFGIGIGFLWVLVMISFALTVFLMWYFTVNIVTTERIVDVDFEVVYTHNVAECQLERIEDVTYTTPGMWASIFDYGNVFIQTAAEQREFDFKSVPRPRDIQDTISDLLETKDG